jgi:hypothetical protein
MFSSIDTFLTPLAVLVIFYSVSTLCKSFKNIRGGDALPVNCFCVWGEGDDEIREDCLIDISENTLHLEGSKTRDKLNLADVSSCIVTSVHGKDNALLLSGDSFGTLLLVPPLSSMSILRDMLPLSS